MVVCFQIIQTRNHWCSRNAQSRFHTRFLIPCRLHHHIQTHTHTTSLFQHIAFQKNSPKICSILPQLKTIGTCDSFCHHPCILPSVQRVIIRGLLCVHPFSPQPPVNKYTLYRFGVARGVNRNRTEFTILRWRAMRAGCVCVSVRAKCSEQVVRIERLLSDREANETLGFALGYIVGHHRIQY